ncbi:unnamed protein product [Coffea canephora]|uniref:MYB transcription factor n=2 Tax=Coffea TaxID=13442 RepID=A0A068U3Q4_COFCA|nr:telomere repeat-binding factor 4-like [Coffea arabica]CDP03136.1 unnamed protein product [Coffea canephora]
MGNPKQKWTSEEEEALRAGVKKHGTGKWKNIQRDPEFSHLLFSRSNIDLKDKWRNLTVSASNGLGPREKSKAQKGKAISDAPATPLPITQVPASSTPLSLEVPADVAADDSSKCLLDGKTASKYNGMIHEALSTLKEPNGSDTSTIVNFIEQRHEVPPNFRRLISARLRRLVAQEKLEKVQNSYRIKKDLLEGSKTPVPKPRDVQPRQAQSIGHLADTVEEATVSAAYTIAEAENKSFVVAEAVKESERVSRMSEDAESMLQLAHEIFDRSSHGEMVLVA